MDNKESPNAYVIKTKYTDEKDIASMTYILEKSERLASAVMRVASIQKDTGGMGEELIGQSIGLLKDASSAVSSTDARRLLLERLGTIASLLRTGARAQTVSRMNAETIDAEILSLTKFLYEMEWASGRVYFDPQTFSVPPVQVALTYERPRPTGYPPSGHDTGIDVTDSRYKAGYDRQQLKVVQDGATSEGLKGHERARGNEIMKDRRATILALLQRKDRITVKDVSQVIKDCSEKTIQRELLTLVGQGVLKKHGEKRWSTYALV